jgi:hypothetical protein
METFDDDCEQALPCYQLIANGNHAAMKKDGFDKEMVSFSNPHGFKKESDYQQWVSTASSGSKVNQICSPTTIRNN